MEAASVGGLVVSSLAVPAFCPAKGWLKLTPTTHGPATNGH
jgi:hypothetical protein